MIRTRTILSVIAAAVAIAAVPFWLVGAGKLDVSSDTSADAPTYTWGINGLTETRCINGYRFIIGKHGHIQQMLDAQGRGVACSTGGEHE